DPRMPRPLLILLFLVAWVGHAAVWTSLLSNLYGRPLPKLFLKLWRLLTGLIILLFPLLAWSIGVKETETGYDFDGEWSVWFVRYTI
ncbi:hypothetical protein ABTM51_20680, partial [Acinetobacter baumannii]